MLGLSVQVLDATYVLPCERVRAVIPRVEVQRVPQAPAWLLGVFRYRGGVTPVVDLCRLIGDYDCSERLSSRIVLVERGPLEPPLGLLAERVTETVRLAPGRAPGLALGASPYLGEMVLEAGRMVRFLELDAILSRVRAELSLAPEALHARATD